MRISDGSSDVCSADLPGQVPVETRLCGLDPFAEAQHDALLVGLHPVEAGKQPHDDDAEADQQVGGLATPAATARQDAAEAALAPLDAALSVGRTRSETGRAPWRESGCMDG